MKKYITIAALLAAGTAFANAGEIVEVEVTDFFPEGIRIAGAASDAMPSVTVAQGAIASNSTYSELNTQIANSESWYVNSGYCNDVGTHHVGVVADAVTFAVGGPSGSTTGTGIKFDLSDVIEEALKDVVGNITFSFETYRSGGNNNKSQGISFALLAETQNAVTSTSTLAYTTGTSSAAGTLPTSAESASQIEFTINTQELIESGNDVLIFAAFVDPLTGSNSGVTMDNFKISYSTAAVPEPSAFGLLAGIGALALVASRRRRK